MIDNQVLEIAQTPIGRDKRYVYCFRLFSFLVSTGIILTYIFVNIELFNQKNTCEYNNSYTTKVLMNVTDNTHGYMVYSYENIICKEDLSNNYAPIGIQVYMYITGSGKCSYTKKVVDCSGSIIMFNVLFTVLFTFPICMVIICFTN
jgi:hypothetical protein